ncbi:flagellar basal body-associated protein FliL [Metabacillus fastidiosus]|uniref:flagellar basal body-associated protein FliL n=1 Tax=Metabacillus fastidiosus TaxID=1458 RepID=UPI003D2C02B9
MNKKLLSIMLIILISITLIGVIAYFVVMKVANGESEASKEPTIDEVVEASVDIPEITTNLATNHIVRLSFKIETDSKKAKEELEKREFQVKDIIIAELGNMTVEQLEGKKGIQKFKETIKNDVNELMHEGKVIKVYTTSYILQ